MLLTAQASAEASESSSQALKTLANSEALNAQKLQSKREFEQKMTKNTADMSMASTGKMVIAGKNAEKFLGYYKEASEIIQ